MERRAAVRIRVVVWNCADGFERKRGALIALRPDIAIIPEVRRKALTEKEVEIGRAAWIGEPAGRGLAVLTFGEWTTEAITCPISDRWFLPTMLRHGNDVEIPLLAVWVKPAENYVAPMLRALKEVEAGIPEPIRLIAGDLNQNVAWDAGKRSSRFEAVLDNISAMGLTSAWHKLSGETHGAETRGTLHFRRDKDCAYHIDYLFAPYDWLQGSAAASIGTFNDWVATGMSDHLPLVVDLSFL